MKQYPDYVVRITADEHEVGRSHLDQFMDIDTKTPVIVTTSRLLTTGVDIPTCANIAIVRMVNSMTEFKQIIGRGTRVRDDYGKLFFNILDYTGAATQKFVDPDFDGDPALITEVKVDEEGNEISEPEVVSPEEVIEEGATGELPEEGEDDTGGEGQGAEPRKYYVNGGAVQIVAHLVYELDADGKKLRVIEFSEYAAKSVRAIATNAAELRKLWASPDKRAELIKSLEDSGIDFDHLAEVLKQPEADRFDLLCYIAFSAPIRTRRERAEALRKGQPEFFAQFSEQARKILDGLLEKYVEYGMEQFKLPEILKVPPLSDLGNVSEIAMYFGSPEKLREAINEVQTRLYAPTRKGI
jgi:type I restriction enzyme R subunit